MMRQRKALAARFYPARFYPFGAWFLSGSLGEEPRLRWGQRMRELYPPVKKFVLNPPPEMETRVPPKRVPRFGEMEFT